MFSKREIYYLIQNAKNVEKRETSRGRVLEIAIGKQIDISPEFVTLNTYKERYLCIG